MFPQSVSRPFSAQRRRALVGNEFPGSLLLRLSLLSSLLLRAFSAQHRGSSEGNDRFADIPFVDYFRLTLPVLLFSAGGSLSYILARSIMMIDSIVIIVTIRCCCLAGIRG